MIVSANFSLWQLYVTRGVIAVPLLIGIMRSRGMGIWPTAPGWAYLRAFLLVLMWIVYRHYRTGAGEQGLAPTRAGERARPGDHSPGSEPAVVCV